jgi:hypothetical protein
MAVPAAAQDRSPDCRHVALALAALLGAGPALADEPIGWQGRQDVDLAGYELMLVPATAHFSPDDEHQNAYLVGVNVVQSDGWLAGASYFRNSFGQHCGYVYVGRRYVEPFGWEKVSWRWTAGLIYGYRGPYEDKVPVNIGGFAPVVVPTIAYQFNRRVGAELVLLGTNAVMLGLVIQIDR